MPVSKTLKVKSIQRGVLTISAGVQTGTATISSVDVNKSTLEIVGQFSDSVSPDRMSARLTLTNSTTITGTKAGTSGQLETTWQVTEYT